ncbi:hypothetical protein M3D63_11915 [Kocuria palustris]|uniref:DUF7448 domain-containing protein n=1 Tax=Kocuria palustris TaxID=71999 RepID=UPI0021A78259|nr:hypothetical protein [Kocuria palustris]MCT1835461.1 hypothetical protein [Kocuria palustris]MDH5151961.1 hypothetical protein [Kocuria palustris]
MRTTDHLADKDRSSYESESDYTIHILAEDHRIADLDIKGDCTSGYYCHSINLQIWNAQKAK